MVVLAHTREYARLSLGSYGRPRMLKELKEVGVDAGHHRFGRLMRENGSLRSVPWSWPLPIRSQRRVRHVAVQNALDELVHGRETGIIGRGLRVVGRETCSSQHDVALSERQGELIAKVQHHLPARSRTARFHKAQVALQCGDLDEC